MTPKEKADKLCIDFSIKPNTTDIKFGMDKQLAKQCALIAVDQIIAILNPENFGIEMDTIFDMKNYWKEVKTEIEKL